MAARAGLASLLRRLSGPISRDGIECAASLRENPPAVQVFGSAMLFVLAASAGPVDNQSVGQARCAPACPFSTTNSARVSLGEPRRVTESSTR